MTLGVSEVAGRRPTWPSVGVSVTRGTTGTAGMKEAGSAMLSVSTLSWYVAGSQCAPSENSTCMEAAIVHRQSSLSLCVAVVDFALGGAGAGAAGGGVGGGAGSAA